MKTHKLAGITLSMKNMFGILPGMKYGWPKNTLHWNGIPLSICEINGTIKTHYSIVDGVVGMEGYGPIMGTPRKREAIAVAGEKIEKVRTLSLRQAVEGEPWTAYGQYCRHFLAPVALMGLKDIRLGQLLRVHLDGIPLDLASSLLPVRTLRTAAAPPPPPYPRQEPKAFRGTSGPGGEGKGWPPGPPRAGRFPRVRDKKTPLARFGNGVGGLLRGHQLHNRRARTQAEDRRGVHRRCPAAGWDNRERMTLFERGPADAVLALALLHHLAIGNNLPLDKAARFFARIGRHLLIEFVPNSDSQVRRLLVTREDIFETYTREGFERAFGEVFTIKRRVPLSGSERALYVMEKK